MWVPSRKKHRPKADSRSSIDATLVKWRRVDLRRGSQISVRLKRIELAGPANVPKLLHFGFSGDSLRLEFNRVAGVPLAKLLRTGAEPQILAKIAAGLGAQAELWAHDNFIHGDLSPTNILVDVDSVSCQVQLWFIDWVVDLNSFEGTPRYASPEVFRGHRSSASDGYAIEKILCIVKGVNHGERALDDERD